MWRALVHAALNLFYHKKLEISLLAAQLSASQERLCSMELIFFIKVVNSKMQHNDCSVIGTHK